MSLSVVFLVLCAWTSSPARALDTESAPDFAATNADTYWDELARMMKNRLASDPEAGKALTARIMESRIARVITGAQEETQGADDIYAWVRANPMDAAHLAVGFSQDDAKGTREFETALFHRIQRRFELNPDRYQGIYGRLHGLATVSKDIEIKKEIPEENRREMIKRFFEGQGSENELRLQDPDGDGRDREGGSSPPGAVAAPKPALADANAFERLAAANPAQLSAKVMSLQNEFNRFRPPGAPKLRETGRLGYETLRYPYYTLKHDIDRLESLLKSQEDYLRNRPAGKDSKAGLEDGFARRHDLLSKARDALGRFDAQASKTKDPTQVSPALLRSLSALHKETARWITAAAVEERIQRIQSLRGFLNPPLLGAIARAPVQDSARQLYRERGKRLSQEVETAASNAGRLTRMLRQGVSSGNLEEAARLDRESRDAARKLPVDVARYVEVPFRLLEARQPVSRLRAYLDTLALRLAPNSDYGRRIRRRRDKEKALAEEFQRVAALQ